MELISPLLRTDFREFCVSYFVLRQIHDIFNMAGVRQGKLTSQIVLSGQRRTLVEEYYSSINWHSKEDTDRYLKVLGYALAQTYLSDQAKKILRDLLHREGLRVDGIQIYRTSDQPINKYNIPVTASTLAELKRCLLDMSKLEVHQRGFAFEKFLTELFDAHGLAPRGSFRLLGEQIDGSFHMNSDTYLIEAKWRAEPISQSELLVFREKVESKSTWARGLIISNSGFSEDGIKAFARGRATNIIGMTGQDLFFILEGEISLSDAIVKKARRAAETGEFYISVFELIRG